MTTVPLMDDDAARAEFRENLAMTLKRIRRKATRYASQQSIADELGVDRETYGRWERGSQEPRVYDLARIWRKFDVPAEWLLDPTESRAVLDRRIASLRHERLTRAATKAADETAGEG